MPEETTEKKETKSTSSMSIAAAIIAAGALIAAAVYLTGISGGRQAVEQAAAPVGEIAQPEGSSLDDIRAVSDSDHIRGSADARITIIEYSDLECPFCQRFHGTLSEIAEAYPNDVRFVFRQFPLEQLHSKAKTEALAAECADEQGKFWEFTDKIFEVTPSNNGLDLSILPDLAQEVGVADIDQFTACLEEKKYSDKVDMDIADAQSAGGRGTPYSIVIGPDGDLVQVSGAQPFEALRQLIDAMLQ